MAGARLYAEACDARQRRHEWLSAVQKVSFRQYCLTTPLPEVVNQSWGQMEGISAILQDEERRLRASMPRARPLSAVIYGDQDGTPCRGRRLSGHSEMQECTFTPRTLPRFESSLMTLIGMLHRMPNTIMSSPQYKLSP